MPDPTFDSLSASTLADMKDSIVYDEFFVEGSLQRKLRASGALDEYLGGTIMQTPFMYDRVSGGAIAPGSNINVIQKQILTERIRLIVTFDLQPTGLFRPDLNSLSLKFRSCHGISPLSYNIPNFDP